MFRFVLAGHTKVNSTVDRLQVSLNSKHDQKYCILTSAAGFWHLNVNINQIKKESCSPLRCCYHDISEQRSTVVTDILKKTWSVTLADIKGACK